MGQARKTLLILGGILNILAVILFFVFILLLLHYAKSEELIREGIDDGTITIGDDSLTIDEQVDYVQKALKICAVVLIFLTIFMAASSVTALVGAFSDSMPLAVINIIFGLFASSIFVLIGGILAVLDIKEKRNKKGYNNELV